MNKMSVKDLKDLKGKKVLVRCDFNVPMKDGKITDENRIQGALPTIKYLLENGADVNVAVETIFKALEKEQFYILDTPKYERLLCEQGVFEAEKIRPVDYYTLN